VSRLITRRGLIVGGAAAAGSLLSACARVDNHWPAPAMLDASDAFTRGAERLLLGRRPLARELSLADISAHFPLSGTFMPKGDVYKRFLDEEFASWRLRVHGLVDRPLSLSLADLHALPSRTQITLHQCDEGWSAVAQWTGVPLGRVLGLAGVQKRARYVVFHCLDQVELDRNYYYESIDLRDATHPQTILAYGMNGKALPVQHGAPLRLRVELQIGYKNAKYVDRIEVVDSLGSIGKGRGGWWEDFDHAIWYAGQ